jgi:hypothetical protein
MDPHRNGSSNQIWEMYQKEIDCDHILRYSAVLSEPPPIRENAATHRRGSTNLEF